MVINELAFKGAWNTVDRLERGLPVQRVDIEQMTAVAERLAVAATLPVRVPCETCSGASQYEGWFFGSRGDASDRRHRGDCPAGCDFGWIWEHSGARGRI